VTPEQLAEAFAEEAAPLFRELVARELAPLRERLAVLEARHAPPVCIVGATIDRAGHLIAARSDGTMQDLGLVVGRDAEVPDVARLLEGITPKGVLLEAPPVPDTAAIAAMVDSAVERSIAALPVPRDGTSVDPAEVERMVEDKVAARVAEIPVPKDGTSVTVDDVAPMIAAEIARCAPPAPVVDESMVELVARRVFDTLPKPKDGKDGIASRDEVTAAARAAVADAVPGEVERAIAEAIKAVPRMEYRGVWTPGSYAKGDVTTFGGHAWICRVEQSEAKPGTCPDWQLMVKKGRDAR